MLHVLRQLVGSPDALLGTAELRLNPEVITSGIASFVDAIVEGNAQEALRHYGGPFLDGVHIDSSAEFQRWAEETREDLARRRALGIEQLAQAADAKEISVLAARLGDRAEAMAADAWLARHPPMFPPGLPQFARARIAAALGERDRAMTLIETLPFRSHPVDIVFFHSDPAFASLRTDERWVRFLKPRG